MKTLISILVFVAISVCGVAQDKFTQAMQSNLEAWGNAKSPEEAEQVRNKFIRIGNAEPTQWLPNYYAAQMYILKGFSVGSIEEAKLLIAEAEKLIVDIRTKEGYSEAEILILEGLKNTVLIANDPGTYGPKLSAETMGLYEKAKALDPGNPRASYLSAEFEMGAAKFFGKPLDEYCLRFNESLKLFDTYELPSPIYPSWGKERLNSLIKECQKNASNN